MFTEFEDIFPDMRKAIQHRKAQFFLLNYQYTQIEKLIKKGQIEGKEAEFLIKSIDEKYLQVQRNYPDVRPHFVLQQIAKNSSMSNVFSKTEIWKALKKMQELKFTGEKQSLY